MATRKRRGPKTIGRAARAHPQKTIFSKRDESLVGSFASRLEDTIGFLVWDTSRVYQRAATPVLARYGIGFGWYNFLRVLYERDGLTLAELSDALRLRGPTTVQAIRGLERQRLVSRVDSTVDGRKVHVHLTKIGRETCEAIVRVSANLNQVGVAGLTKKEQATLKRLLRHIRENVYLSIAEGDDLIG